MLMPAMRQRGFTLIEALVGVSLFAILLGVGVPAMSVWIERAGVQAITENLQNGLRIAQEEAIKRNVPVEFMLVSANASAVTSGTPAATSTNNWTTWTIRLSPGGAVIRSEDVQRDRATNSTTLASGRLTDNRLVFTGFGRVVDANGANLPNPAVFLIKSVSGNRTRCVYVTPGAAIKACDPSVPAGNPIGCGLASTNQACLAAN